MPSDTPEMPVSPSGSPEADSGVVDTSTPRKRNKKHAPKDIDRRFKRSRDYDDLRRQLLAELGPNPSTREAILAEEAARAATWCKQAHAKALKGEPLKSYPQGTSNLRRLIDLLGIKDAVRLRTMRGL